MKKIALIFVVFAFFIYCPSDSQSQEVGDSAPDFSLVDVSGNDVRLSDFKGKKNVVLVFYQWHSCRRCREQLSELQEQISEIIKLNSELIAISSAGDRDNVERTKSSIGITFTLIPTPNKKVVFDFGLKYTGAGGRVHAVIIIDKKGLVRFKRVDTWPSLTKTSTIIKELQAIQ